jgi:hypothetical protein
MGQAALVYRKIEDAEEFSTYILSVLAHSPNFGLLSADTAENTLEFLEQYPFDIYMKDVHLTTRVLKAFDYTTDQYTAHHLRVEAEYLNETGDNRNKTVQYSTAALGSRVVLMIFEAPTVEWEQAMQDYSLLLDYFVIISR